MKTLTRSLLVLVLATSTAAPATAQEIGTVASANAVLDGTPVGAARRTLSVGQRVIGNERISSSESGSGQLLFLDQTTLSIAPNSDIVLDRYVYDPDRNAGEIAATMAKGVLRFIGGRITNTNEATIRTPVATVGIRGGMAVIEVCETPSPTCPGGLAVIHIAGQYTRVTARGQTRFRSRPSARATVAPGGVPVFTGLADSGDIARLITRLEGAGRSAPRRPTSQELETRLAMVTPVGSDERGGPYRRPVSTGGQEPEPLGIFEERVLGFSRLGTFSHDRIVARDPFCIPLENRGGIGTPGIDGGSSIETIRGPEGVVEDSFPR